MRTSAVETQVLKQCLAIGSVDFRRLLAEELFRRDSIDSEEARTLLQSPDARTRLIGARTVRKTRFDFSLADARSIIVKPRASNALGVFSPSNRDEPGEEAFDEYKHEVLCEKSHSDLLALRDGETIYRSDVTFAIYDRYFKETKKALVESIRENFNSYLTKKLELHPDPQSAPDDGLVTYLRNNLYQRAIALICKKRSKGEIDLVRQSVDMGRVQFSDDILRFFESFGTWEDVIRIIKLCGSFPSRNLFHFGLDTHKAEYAASAKALLKLGGSRIGDLLTLEMPVDLKCALFREVGGSTFAAFDDARILNWLRSEAEALRKVVALRSVLHLQRVRLSRILEEYQRSGELYFYNVVFWLDLGLSTDKAISKSVAQRELVAG